MTSGVDSTDALTFSETTGAGSVNFATPSLTVGGVATDVVTGNGLGSVTIKAAGTVHGTATSSNTLSFTVVPGALDHFVVPTPAGTPVATPSAPTVSPTCTILCTTAWHYEVTAVNASGETTPGSSVSASNESSLSSGHYNTVTMPSLPSGATSLNLYRSSGSGSFSLIATGQSAGVQVKDTGLPSRRRAADHEHDWQHHGRGCVQRDHHGRRCLRQPGQRLDLDNQLRPAVSGPHASPNNTTPFYGSQGSCAAGQTSLTFDATGQATLSVAPFAAETTT